MITFSRFSAGQYNINNNNAQVGTIEKCEDFLGDTAWEVFHTVDIPGAVTTHEYEFLGIFSTLKDAKKFAIINSTLF